MIHSLRRINNAGQVLSVPSTAHDAAMESLQRTLAAIPMRPGVRVKLHTWARGADDLPCGTGWMLSNGSQQGYDRWEAEVTPL